MIAPTVLVIEDDFELRRVIVRGLEEEGFSAAALGSGGELLEALKRETPDLLVLDIGLPDADGRDVCQAIRAQGVQSPVLFLTARDALTDRLAGFSAGGDDYLAKPFAFAELVARCRALIRRPVIHRPDEEGGLRLDPVAHAAFVDQAMIRLTPTEFRVLARLVAYPGEAVRRADLLRAAWPHGARVSGNTLDSYIARLRRKLGSFDGAPTITTVHGVGYRVD